MGTVFFKTANEALLWLADEGFRFSVALGVWINSDGRECRYGKSAAGHSISEA